MPNGLGTIAAHDEPLLHGYRWEIRDPDALAYTVALLIVGQYRYAASILQDLGATPLPTGEASRRKKVALLRVPANSDHRDGWIFQMISWVAAYAVERKPCITPPHPQPADKGFDSVLLRVSPDRTRMEGIVIGEDKATQNARATITQKVWPEITSLETGARDDEVTQAVISLLERYFPSDVEQHLQAAFWQADRRAYRVCIGSHDFSDSSGGRAALFAGYTEVAKGSTLRRRAETLYTQGDVRTWMTDFCERVAQKLEGLP